MSALAVASPVLPAHLGALHPVEQVLTIALAFGPFLVLAAVIAVRRRQDAALDRAATGVGDATTHRPASAESGAPGEAQREAPRER